MRADDWNNVPSSARGRDSVRIVSKKAWDESAVVLDLSHMPEGCGTWPAFWSLSQKGPWPSGGEIDIVEGTSHAGLLRGKLIGPSGVNLNTANLASMHTTPSCMMPEHRFQSG